MRGIKPDNILLLARKDAERVKNEARFVICINADGKILSSKANNNGKIWSIAVIGPASLFKKEIEEALIKVNFLEEALLEKELLLLEIGIKRGKPYCMGFNRETKKNILWRRKWFCLSEKQYAEISQLLVSLIKRLCQETWESWETSKKNPYIVYSGKSSESFRRHVCHNHGGQIVFPGIRYSVSLEDS